MLLVILNEDTDVYITPPNVKLAPPDALLLANVLLVILNENSDVSITPPLSAAQLLVKALMVILNEDLNVSICITPPLYALLLVKCCW